MNIDIWECPDCNFQMVQDKKHVDSGGHKRHSCPVCKLEMLGILNRQKLSNVLQEMMNQSLNSALDYRKNKKYYRARMCEEAGYAYGHVLREIETGVYDQKRTG